MTHQAAAAFGTATAEPPVTGFSRSRPGLISQLLQPRESVTKVAAVLSANGKCDGSVHLRFGDFDKQASKVLRSVYDYMSFATFTTGGTYVCLAYTT